jgi:hypothetical protein
MNGSQGFVYMVRGDLESPQEHAGRQMDFVPLPEVLRKVADAVQIKYWLPPYTCRTGQLVIKRNDLRTFATDIGITKAGVERALTANA